jgi:hypothetical protein
VNGYAVQDAWVKYAQEQRDKESRRQQEASRQWDARWHSAGDWCAEHVPDLIDRTTGVSCGFAVGAALRLRSELGRMPTADEVRRRRREWMRRLDLDPRSNVRATMTVERLS